MANRNVWQVGLFSLTHNTESNLWDLTRDQDGAFITSGHKAKVVAKIGSTLTKLEKIQSKRAKLEAELAQLIQDEDDARGKFTEALVAHEAYEASKAPPVLDIATASRVELLEAAKEAGITGRHKLKLHELRDQLAAA